MTVVISDVNAVIWKEWKEQAAGFAGTRGGAIARIGIVVVIFGVVVPWGGGAEYLDNAASLVVPILLPLMGLSGIVPDSFAGERERRTLETLLTTRLHDTDILLGKVLSSVLLIVCVSLFIVILSVIGVNVLHSHGQFLFFSIQRFVLALTFGVLLALTITCAGVLISLRSSTISKAAQTLMASTMLTFFVGLVGFQVLLPDNWREALIRNLFTAPLRFATFAAGVLIVVDVLLFLVARLRFRRARLILD